MAKKYKVVNLPDEPTRHHLGNFGLVLIQENLPQEICEAGFKAGLPYFEEIADESKSIIEANLEVVTEPKSEVVAEPKLLEDSGSGSQGASRRTK